jgi:hypothetical protein
MELIPPQVVRIELNRWWYMPFSEHPWFLIGVLVAIALFATVCALSTQVIFGRNFASVLMGPAIAVIAVIVFWRLHRPASPK